MLFLLFVASNVIANEWSAPTEVKDINTGYKGGMILFNTVATHHNPNSNCRPTWYSVKSDTAEVSHILSVLLAAQLSSTKIQVGVNSGVCSSDGNKYISVSRIRVKK